MLTDAQIPALAAAIAAEADPTFVALRQAGATGQMAEWLNQPSAFIAWKSVVSEHDITSLVSDEGTVWSWSAYISRSAAEQNAWARMFNGTYTINPSLPQVRAGITDIFSGGTGTAQRAHLSAIGKRPATRAEAVFAAGTGTAATPGTLTVEGSVSDYDVIRALSV